MKDEMRWAGVMLALILAILVIFPFAFYVYTEDNGIRWVGYLFDTVFIMIIHELGHIAFAFVAAALSPALGTDGARLLVIMGGTLFQVGLPLAGGVAAIVFRQRPLALCLISVSLFSAWDAGRYMSSAEHPTGLGISASGHIGPMTPENHDWTNILASLGLLGHGNEIAALTMGVGAAYGLAFFFAGLAAILTEFTGGRVRTTLFLFFGGISAGFFLFANGSPHTVYLIPGLAIVGLAVMVDAYFAMRAEDSGIGIDEENEADQPTEPDDANV